MAASEETPAAAGLAGSVAIVTGAAGGVGREVVRLLVGAGADVAAIWTGKTDRHVIWENEFFNRSVGLVYDTGDAIGGGLQSTAVSVGPDGYLRDPDGRLLHHRYVLVDGSLDLNGTKVASDTPIGINLWKLRGPVRSVTQVDGLYPNDTWSGAFVDYRRLECGGGAVRVTLFGDVNLFKRAQTVRAAGVTKRVPAGVPTTMTVPLRDCAAHFAVSPTKVPGHGDPRILGIHFLSFEYVASS
jgi:hypothetical protein